MNAAGRDAVTPRHHPRALRFLIVVVQRRAKMALGCRGLAQVAASQTRPDMGAGDFFGLRGRKTVQIADGKIDPTLVGHSFRRTHQRLRI